MASVRSRILINGRVQGVGFRMAAADAAGRLHLAGFVRNLPSGAVEAEVEGGAEAVQAFVAWCRQGPAAARVHDVEVESQAPRGERGFRIASSW